MCCRREAKRERDRVSRVDSRLNEFVSTHSSVGERDRGGEDSLERGERVSECGGSVDEDV